jgi:hypothetical protein
MKNPTTLIVAVFLTVSQISFAQQNEKKREVLFDIGLTSQTLLDKHIYSLSWSGMGLGTTVSYQKFIKETFVLKTEFSFSKLQLANITDYKINSHNFNIDLFGMWNIISKTKHNLFTGIATDIFLNTRNSDIDYRNFVFDGWVSLAWVSKYSFDIGKLYGETQFSLPLVSAVVTQNYVNNSRHLIYFASFNNSFKIDTQTSMYYRLNKRHSIGLKYKWNFYSLDINKQIINGVNYYLITYKYNI